MVMVQGGGHSHGGGSSGAHSHGPTQSGDGGVFVAIGLGIVVVFGIVVMVVHIISSHAALRHDSALTPQDKEIQAASFSIACHEIEEVNGTQQMGPRCSPAVKSGTLAIQLLGLPRDVTLADSQERGSYSARCTVIAGGDQVAGGGGSMVTGPSGRKRFPPTRLSRCPAIPVSSRLSSPARRSRSTSPGGASATATPAITT